MDSLANNPSGNIYGQPAQTGNGDVLELVNQLRDRDMRDFKDKSNFMSDLSLKQDKMRAMFNPDRLGLKDNQQPLPNQEMNTVLGQDPNAMTGYEKNKIGLEQQNLGLERQKIAQSGKLSQNALDIKQQQADLAQQKSDQIHAQKQSDMERKIAEADKKLEFAKQKLETDSADKEKSLQAHKDLAAAMEERHKLELAQKDAQFQRTSEQHQQTIDRLNKDLEQKKNTKTTTELNADGSKKTVTTERGDTGTVQVIGKDGKSYTIPKNKLNDMDADGTPHWKQQEEE
jgi:hypothetical protein